MYKHIIEFSELTPKGHIEFDITEGILNMTAARAIHDVGYNIIRDRITSYIPLPEKYRLPMEIDMTIKTDSPEVIVLIGEGHVTIGSPWMENRRLEDIAEPAGKPRTYDNYIPLNEFVDIKLIYNLKEMQILINGEERYFSTKERYMKANSFQEKNDEGFMIGVTCTKRAKLGIKDISVTEYEDRAPLSHDLGAASQEPPREGKETAKPTFESCTGGLPDPVKEEIKKTEALLKSLKHLKFKRIIEKHGNKITYVASNAGVSYALYLSGNVMHHSLQWYILTNGKPEEWGRKADLMEDVLAFLYRTMPESAERMFHNLNECIGCRKNCLAKTEYSFRSRKKLTCHGHMFFKMHIPDFQDVRDYFSCLDALRY